MCKGRALEAPDIGDRLGPLLRELIADAEGRGTYEIRDRLAGELTRMAHRLSPELRIAVMAGPALHPATRGMARYTERSAWLAGELGRPDRTAARRMEEAVAQLSLGLASELLRQRDPEIAAHDGWHLRELRTVVRLDDGRLDALEVCRIVSTRPGLEQVTLEMYIPARPGEPDPRPLGGEAAVGGADLRWADPPREAVVTEEIGSAVSAGSTAARRGTRIHTSDTGAGWHLRAALHLPARTAIRSIRSEGGLITRDSPRGSGRWTARQSTSWKMPRLPKPCNSRSGRRDSPSVSFSPGAPRLRGAVGLRNSSLTQQMHWSIGRHRQHPSEAGPHDQLATTTRTRHRVATHRLEATP
jgi:hypothetical protein